MGGARPEFGEFFRERRLALGKTLRQFCQEHRLDPGNISRLERGKVPPPKHEKLEQYAHLLQFEEGSDEWCQFFDLAAAEAGRLPADLQADTEILDRMPVLFRTLRGQKVSDEDLDDLIDLLRRA